MFGSANRKVVIIYGGKLSEEYAKSDAVMRIILMLDRAGKAKQVKKSLIAAQTAKLANKNLKSNDIHVIALALASNTRLLCTDDDALTGDFTNKTVIR